MSIIIESLKNTYKLCDYTYVSDHGSMRTKTNRMLEEDNLPSLPNKGLYILSHPVFGKFYLGLSKGDKNKRGVHQRQLAHGGKLLGKFGKNITDAGAWAELRQEALAMGMDLYKDLFEKVKITVIPLEHASDTKIEDAETYWITKGLLNDHFRCNGAKRRPCMSVDDMDSVNIFLEAKVA